MKPKLSVVVTGFIIVFVSICLLFYGYINVYGKSLLTRKLARTFGREVFIGSMYVSFPADLTAKRVEVKGLLSIDELNVGGGVFDLLRARTFRVSSLEVIRPIVTIEQSFFKAMAEMIAVGEIGRAHV
jgi:hypothetical protein